MIKIFNFYQKKQLPSKELLPARLLSVAKNSALNVMSSITILFLTILFVSSSSLVVAQKTVRIGTVNSLETSAFGINSYNQKRQWSSRVGMDVLVSLNPKWSIETGLRYGYMQHFFKPYSLECGNTTNEEITITQAKLDKEVDYIFEIPIGIRYNFGLKNAAFKPYIEPFNSFIVNLNGKINGDIGLKTGVACALSNRLALFIQPTFRYMYFIENQGLFEVPNTLSRRSTLGVELGINRRF